MVTKIAQIGRKHDQQCFVFYQVSEGTQTDSYCSSPQFCRQQISSLEEELVSLRQQLGEARRELQRLRTVVSRASRTIQTSLRVSTSLNCVN